MNGDLLGGKRARVLQNVRGHTPCDEKQHRASSTRKAQASCNSERVTTRAGDNALHCFDIAGRIATFKRLECMQNAYTASLALAQHSKFALLQREFLPPERKLLLLQLDFFSVEIHRVLSHLRHQSNPVKSSPHRPQRIELASAAP